MFTAQEILVGNADYPTEKIAETSRVFRQLGLGYANLGALLMAQGMPYDSDDGRAWAAAITVADDRPRVRDERADRRRAWARSRATPRTSEPMLNVLRMHRAEAAQIDEDLVPAGAAVRGAARRGTKRSSSASATACATRRRRCSRPPAPSA